MLLKCGHRQPAGNKFCSVCGAKAEMAGGGGDSAVAREVGGQDKMLVVRRVARKDQDQVLAEKAFRLRGGKLPLADVRRHFGIARVVWVELEEVLEADKDGLSTILFGAFEGIKIME